jgi:hypothetical protein
MSAQPPIVTGPDGLPHCGWCLNENVLCGPHRERVSTALNSLKSPHLLANAQTDLRYIVHRKDKYADPEA